MDKQAGRLNITLPQQDSDLLTRALTHGDPGAVVHLCSDKLSTGHAETAFLIATESLAILGFHPQLSGIAGEAARVIHRLDDAYFHLFNAFAETGDVAAGCLLCRTLLESQNRMEALALLAKLNRDHPENEQVTSINKLLESTAPPVEQGKSNFLMSAHSSVLPSSLAGSFIADPFVAYQFDRNGTVREKSLVAPFLRGSADDTVKFVDLVLAKQEKYLQILVPRLNELHGAELSYEFWRRSFSLSLERLIGVSWDIFQMCELYFDPVRYTCRTFSESSYFVPLDFDEQRYLVEHWNYGREQMFSCYMHEFHPGEFLMVEDRFQSPYKVREVTLPTSFQPVVGIMGAFFAPFFHKQLVEKSNGRINEIGFRRDLQMDTSNVDFEKRDYISRRGDDFDRFDRFFFRCLKWQLPKVLVEFFPNLIKSMAEQLGQYTQLRYIVSEMWIGESYEPIALALLKETRGVQTIFNEHNINTHPYKASLVPRWASYCDIYAAHGNYGEECPNVVQLGSMYNFGYDLDVTRKDHRITYISGLSLARNSDFCCCDSASGIGEYAGKKYEFKRRFFSALSEDIRGAINYRGYPFDDYLKHWNAYYDDNFLMGDALIGIHRDDLKRSGKEVIAASELVIVDYMMTSYLEAIFIDVPTVILFSGDLDAFNDRHSGYLDTLIEVGICQTDPLKAAVFISEVLKDPASWWMQPRVREVREEFIRENIGDPMAFFNYLLALST